MSTNKEEFENLSSGDDLFTVAPSIVTLGPGVRITNVAAGGRHTLALSGSQLLLGSLNYAPLQKFQL